MPSKKETPVVGTQVLSQTPYAVLCPTHGKVFLTIEEYDQQFGCSHWECPCCGEVSVFDDEHFKLVFSRCSAAVDQQGVTLTVEESDILVAFADEQDKWCGVTGWGPKFDAVMKVAQRVRTAKRGKK